MSRPHPMMSPRERRLRNVARLAVTALVVAAVVLGVLLGVAVVSRHTERAAAGDSVPLLAPPYGRTLTVSLPGTTVTVVVGDPVDRIGSELLVVDDDDDPRAPGPRDLGAPEGGSLVPVSWRAQRNGGLSSDDDSTPITIRLVAGGQPVELGTVALGSPTASIDAFEPQNAALAFADDLDAADLTVEVEYDGLTQTADVASGKIDAGVAQSLYDGSLSFTAGCTGYEDGCRLVTDPDSPLRPAPKQLTTSYVSLYPYDAELGWAAEGTQWAAVRVTVLEVYNYVQNAAGQTWPATIGSSPVVTLDGAEPVRSEIEPGSALSTGGRVVFVVDADAEPRELGVEQVTPFKRGGSLHSVRTHARLELTPVG